MRCISPIDLGKNKVPCGKCNFCLQAKRGDWSFRLKQEWKRAPSAHFLSFTYDQQHLPYTTVETNGVCFDVPSLCKRDMQLFFKRLRKACEPVKLRHYTVGEYGGLTSRPHYHSILFGLPFTMVSQLHDIWQQGNIYVGSVRDESIHYVTKYVINRHGEFNGREPPFALMSRNPGIGAGYLGTHTDWHRSGMRNFAQVNGITTRLPRYYKDKIFNEEEREVMAKESAVRGVESFYEELKRISKFHDDPYAHYAERVKHMHDAVTSKLNENDKL